MVSSQLGTLCDNSSHKTATTGSFMSGGLSFRPGPAPSCSWSERTTEHYYRTIRQELPGLLCWFAEQPFRGSLKRQNVMAPPRASVEEERGIKHVRVFKFSLIFWRVFIFLFQNRYKI
jgi:hypothetical protein